jgi:hypothetical protein
MAKRGGKRRDPAREKFWRRTIREQQRSGLSVRDSCHRKGVRRRHPRPPQPAARFDELLPGDWFRSHPSARRKTAA